MSRVPTPLVATLIGVFLSTWLLPAFTRQWDDRQNARELQAAVVGDIVASTVKALNEAQRASDGYVWKDADGTPDPWAMTAASQWSVASSQIQAKLRIYFGNEASSDWRVVRSAVSALLYLAGASSLVDDPVAGTQSLQDLLWRYQIRHDNMFDLRHELLTLEDDIARAVLKTHVSGYSTRWRDIAKDVLPFW